MGRNVAILLKTLAAFLCLLSVEARDEAFDKLINRAKTAVMKIEAGLRQGMEKEARCKIAERCKQGSCIIHGCSGGAFGDDFKCATNLEIVGLNHTEHCSDSSEPTGILLNKEEPFLMSPGQSQNVSTEGDGSSVVVKGIELLRDICVAKTLRNTIRDAHTENNLNEWIYFGTESKIMYSYPGHVQVRPGSSFSTCRPFDPTIRPWYTTAASGPKDVVFLLDISGSSDRSTLQDALIETINNLDNRDFVSVVTYDSSATAATLGKAEGLQKAISATRKALGENVKDLSFSTSGSPNVTSAFQKAFDILRDASEQSSKCSRLIVLLSADEDACFQTCTGQSSNTECKCVQNLRNYIEARQNELQGSKASLVAFTEVGGGSSNNAERLARTVVCDARNNGIWRRVTENDSAGTAMNTYSQMVAASLFDDKPDVISSDLYNDFGGLGLIFTLTVPVYASTRIVGVVGADITLKSVVEAVGDEELAREEIELLGLDARSCGNRVTTRKSCELQALREQTNSAVCADIFPPSACYRLGESLYKLVTTALPFDQAQAECQALGGAGLAKIDTFIKNQFLSGFASADGSWIGLKADIGKSLQWLDGTALNETNLQFDFEWKKKVVSIHEREFNTAACATADRRGTSGNWNLEPCTAPRTFVCEFGASTKAATTECDGPTFTQPQPGYVPVNDVSSCPASDQSCTEAEDKDVAFLDPICREANSTFSPADRTCCCGKADQGCEDGGCEGGVRCLPLWIWPLIGVGALVLVLVCAIIYYRCVRQPKRGKESNQDDASHQDAGPDASPGSSGLGINPGPIPGPAPPPGNPVHW